MFRKILIVSILTINLFFNASAQFINQDASSAGFQQFLKNKTVFVLQADASFNIALQAAVKKTWTLGAYDFVKEADFGAKQMDKNTSFVLPQNLQVQGGNGSTATHYYWAAVNGGKKKYAYEDVVAFVPFDFFGNEKTYAASAYRLENMVAALQEGIKIGRDKKLQKSKNGLVDAMISIYHRAAVGLKAKTLLVNTEYLDAAALAIFKKNYPYPFKMATTQEIKAAIAKKDGKTAYLLLSRSLNKHIFAIDAATGKTLYADFTTQNAGLTTDDVKRFCKTALGK